MTLKQVGQAPGNYWAWNFESISFITGSSNFSSAPTTTKHFSSRTKPKPVVVGLFKAIKMVTY